MAEAIGVLGSVIAIYQLADRANQILSNIRHAPAGLLALHNEVSDLTATLRTVETCLRTRQNASLIETRHISDLLERAKNHFTMLNQLIHMRFLDSGTIDGSHTMFRLRWAREKETVERYRNALRDIRSNIITELISINYLMLSRIPLLVEEISLISDQMQASQIHASNQILRQLGTQSESATSLAQNLGGLLRLLQSTTPPQGNVAARAGSSVVANDSPASSTVRFRAYISQWRRHCASNCGCDCHRTYSFRSPPFLDQLLGLLFVGYSGKPFGKLQKCSRLSCHSRFKVQVNYVFPFWFVRRTALDLLLILGYNTEPSITLTVRGVFTSLSDLYQSIQRDDSDGVCRAIASGGARPNDQATWNGSSALYMSLVYGRFEASRALLTAGANPSLENHPLRSPYIKAWELIYENQHDVATLDMLRGLFPDADNSILEERCFSQVHMAVLGLTSNSLETVLLENCDQINKVDLYGRTALSWAVRRGDLRATKLLLEAGADPNIGDMYLDHCLILAARGGNLAMMKLLLRGGALANLQNYSGSNPLHLAAEESSCPEIINILIAAGADIEQQDNGGSRPLALAACFSEVVTVESLLKFRPSVNTQDHDGDTPLSNAVLTGRNESVKILLQHNANYLVTNNTGNTILHHVARGGDIETLNILQATNLTTINPNSKNSDGKTAFEIAQQRHSKPEGFVDLLLVLLLEIRCRNDYVCAHSQSSQGSSDLGSVGINHDGAKEDASIKIPGAWPCQ